MPRFLTLLAGATLVACADDLPTATHPLTPVDPVTFEVRLPWSQFASNLRVIGGFGRPIETGRGLLAHEFAGELEARTLVRFPNFPRSISVADSLGTTRTDTMMTFVGANVLVRFDTAVIKNTGPLALRVHRIDSAWDPASATWIWAVDTVGSRLAWAQPGGGPLVPLSDGTWDPATSQNQAILPLDVAETEFLRDTTNANRGLAVTLETPGKRVEVQTVVLQLQLMPSINADSLIFLEMEQARLTYIYTPEAGAPPADELRSGGVPAWRSILTLGLPATVPGTPAACARTTCPIALTAERINHASLLLTTKPVDPAFAPSDTMKFELRGVLAPEFLPKSPLASAQFVDSIGLPVGSVVPPSAFQQGSTRVVELPLTPLLRDLIAGPSGGLFRPTPTIALMEVLEPFSFAFGSFVGPGQIGEPVLRLVVTISDPVGLP